MDTGEALRLLQEYTKSESLIKHALSVEAAMHAYARRFEEDAERWGIVGILHDFDYEMYPTADKHPAEGAKVLKERGYPEDVIYAILSHADYLGLERKSLMDKTLFAVDELTGLITAAALVRPNKSIMDLEASSVLKKMKDKAFARSVSRDDIHKGAQELGIELKEHVAFVIAAMRGIAGELGLDGN